MDKRHFRAILGACLCKLSWNLSGKRCGTSHLSRLRISSMWHFMGKPLNHAFGTYTKETSLRRYPATRESQLKASGYHDVPLHKSREILRKMCSTHNHYSRSDERRLLLALEDRLPVAPTTVAKCKADSAMWCTYCEVRRRNGEMAVWQIFITNTVIHHPLFCYFWLLCKLNPMLISILKGLCVWNLHSHKIIRPEYSDSRAKIVKPFSTLLRSIEKQIRLSVKEKMGSTRLGKKVMRGK